MNLLPHLSTLLPAEAGGTFWLPEAASTVADETDGTFWLVMWISVVFFAIIVVGMVWFMVAYRRRPGVDAVLTATHNYPLELSWSIIPTLLTVVIFAEGFTGFLNLKTPPDDSYDIGVNAKRWSWSFTYPNGVSSTELHAPKGRDVRLVMESSDVLHSLYIRDFRIKQDVVPGRFTFAWFNALRASEPGAPFPLQCTEYCGTNHSDMGADVVIHETEDEFACWLQEEYAQVLNMPPLELGLKVYNEKGCVQCHALGKDQKQKQGPNYYQTYMNTHEFKDGSSGVGDENYIKESILNPQAKIRKDYGANMPSYAGQLLPQEINGLIAFIKAQNPDYKTQMETEYSKPLTDADTADEEVSPNDPCVRAKAAKGGRDDLKLQAAPTPASD